MLIEHSNGTQEFIPDHLVELLAEAQENEKRGVFWYTCPHCNYTTRSIHEVYEHKLENCRDKNSSMCEICEIEFNPDIEHYRWHGYECLQDGIQKMRAKLRPHRSTPYKPPKTRTFKEEKGKGKVASISKPRK